MDDGKSRTWSTRMHACVMTVSQPGDERNWPSLCDTDHQGRRHAEGWEPVTREHILPAFSDLSAQLGQETERWLSGLGEEGQSSSPDCRELQRRMVRKHAKMVNSM